VVTPLPLKSPRWAKLETWTGDAADLPRLIEALRAAAKVAGHTAFAELQEMIYQQGTCCEATTAVTPYLVELAGRATEEDRGELLSLLGSIAATADEDVGPDDLWRAFERALEAAEPLCVRYFLEADLDLPTAYDIAVACFGVGRHPLGRLEVDNYWPHDDAETRAECPKCGRTVQVAAFDTGLVVERSARNPYPPAPDPGLPPEPPEQPEPPDEPLDPNPWAPMLDAIRAHRARGAVPAELAPHFDAAEAVTSDGYVPAAPPSAAFSLLGVMLTLKGFGEPAYRYFHASDHITCPKCKVRFRFADRWWKLDL
jgi:hypothetical protein